MNLHVKSKEWVTQFAEVLPPLEIANAVLDLVKQETERIDARFLDPACRTGLCAYCMPFASQTSP